MSFLPLCHKLIFTYYENALDHSYEFSTSSQKNVKSRTSINKSLAIARKIRCYHVWIWIACKVLWPPNQSTKSRMLQVRLRESKISLLFIQRWSKLSHLARKWCAKISQDVDCFMSRPQLCFLCKQLKTSWDKPLKLLQKFEGQPNRWLPIFKSF